MKFPWLLAVVLTAFPVAAFALPASGTEFRDCANCPPMVVLPRGTFTMGSPNAEPGRQPNEGPQHRVRISYPLAVAKHEVTFAEWDACVADGGCDNYHPDDEGWGRATLPVIGVTWFDARAYSAWLSHKTGKHYRLLSEAEWEFGARAGTTTGYSWGKTPSHEYANYGQDDCCGGFTDGRDQWMTTAPAESFPANAFGLHDMLGNVWEWVEDCWDETHAGAPSDGSVRKTGDCGRHVMRGGAWSSMPDHLRAAFRDAYPPEDHGSFIGFRVARSE